jgi:hypothetical protein
MPNYNTAQPQYCPDITLPSGQPLHVFAQLRYCQAQYCTIAILPNCNIAQLLYCPTVAFPNHGNGIAQTMVLPNYNIAQLLYCPPAASPNHGIAHTMVLPNYNIAQLQPCPTMVLPNYSIAQWPASKCVLLPCKAYMLGGVNLQQGCHWRWLV